MAILASAYINWSALWKICVAALIGGAGVVIVFGFLLLGVKIANNAKGGGREWAGYALVGRVRSLLRGGRRRRDLRDPQQAGLEAGSEEDGGRADRAVLQIDLVAKGHQSRDLRSRNGQWTVDSVPGRP